MEDKINKVFNILEVEEYYANLLLETGVCVLLGCRVEKDEDEETTFVYSVGQFRKYNIGVIHDAIFKVVNDRVEYEWYNDDTRLGGDLIQIL